MTNISWSKRQYVLRSRLVEDQTETELSMAMQLYLYYFATSNVAPSTMTFESVNGFGLLIWANLLERHLLKITKTDYEAFKRTQHFNFLTPKLNLRVIQFLHIVLIWITSSMF